MTTTTPRSATASLPASEPVSLAEAKRHLEIAETDDTHDTHVSSLVVAAREVWEHDTQTLTASRPVVENIDQWPDSDWRFYYLPVSAVDSITYFDESNTSQTLAPSVYSLDVGNRRLLLDVDQDWPSIETRWDAIAITYTAGQTLIDEIAKHAMKLQIDLMFELRGLTKEKDSVVRAYEALVSRYMRSSYP